MRTRKMPANRDTSARWAPPRRPGPSPQKIVGTLIAWLIVACVIAALSLLLGWLVELAFR